MSWLSKMFGSSGDDCDTKAKPDSTPKATLMVVIDNKEYPVVEITVKSLRVKPYGGGLVKKQNFGFTAIINAGGQEYKSASRGVVRAQNEKEGLVAQYTPFSPAFAKKLRENFSKAK